MTRAERTVSAGRQGRATVATTVVLFAALAGRVYAGRLPWQVVKRLGLSGGRVRAAAASARPGDGAR